MKTKQNLFKAPQVSQLNLKKHAKQSTAGEEICNQQLEEDLKRLGGMYVLSNEDMASGLIVNQPFRSDSFVIFAILKGELHFQNNFVSYCLREKDIFFAKPGSLCELKHISADVSFLGLRFQRDYLKKQGIYLSSAETLYMFSSGMKQQHSLSEEEFADIFLSMSSLKKKIRLSPETPHFNEIIRHSFLSVLYEILLIFNKQKVINPVKLNRQEELTSDFLVLLSENFKKEKRVHYYAKALLITPRHLSQVVKQVTGKTAGELIDEVIMKEAQVLLSGHIHNIAQVADILEFSDQSFFGKFFKKHRGISPSEYRLNSTIALNPPF